MGTPSQLYLLPSVTAMVLVFAAPHTLAGQTSSARPAAVSLTIVVPSRRPLGASLASDERATVLHRDATMLDLEAMIELADRPASRIEVRLGRGWPTDAAPVLVRNQNGQFEPLDDDSRVVAVDMPPSFSSTRTAVRFRVASNRAMPTSMAIPVEYRITVGAADQIAVYTYPSVIQLGGLQ
jgi:hypothetical protein